MARDPNAQPVAGDDVSDAVWMRVDDLRGLGGESGVRPRARV
jgi:hypothetical protein